MWWVKEGNWERRRGISRVGRERVRSKKVIKGQDEGRARAKEGRQIK